MKNKMVTFSVPEDVWKQVRHLALESNLTVSAEASLVLREGLTRLAEIAEFKESNEPEEPEPKVEFSASTTEAEIVDVSRPSWEKKQ